MPRPGVPKPVPPSAIRIDFVGHGDVAVCGGASGDRLQLDSGNRLSPGVIDHHQLSAYAGSTASLVCEHADLVLGSISRRRAKDAPFTLVLHADPDLDCLASAWLAMQLLSTGALPDGAGLLARYVDAVDQGRLGASQDQPFTLYTAFRIVAHRLGQRAWPDPADAWRERMREGMRLLDFVMARARAGAAIPEIDAFECPGLFGPADRRDVSGDLTRYERAVSRPDACARILQLRLPGPFGGTRVVDSLVIRDVQREDDEAPTLFFKDWARTDRRRSPSGQGFVALSVSETRSADRRSRSIISVRPDAGVSLSGLANRLDALEHERRIRLAGYDDREFDAPGGARRPPRPGYPTADPWYDGRAHGYTIVDAPRSWSVLPVDDIERALIDYGSRAEQDAAPLGLPSPGADAARGVDPASLGLLTSAARAGLAHVETPIVPPIFLSYPRARLDWVRAHVYEPVAQRFGADRVFFDVESLTAGAAWLATLAAGVQGCRAFVAVYCAEYFQSEFCQWELQLALARDPLGRRGIVVPLFAERVDLPAYCSLVQAETIAGDRLPDRVLTTIGRAVHP